MNVEINYIKKLLLLTKFNFKYLVSRKSFLLILVFVPFLLSIVFGTFFLPIIYSAGAIFFLSTFLISSFGYGIVFFNIKKSQAYKILNKEINNKFIIYFSNYIINFFIIIIHFFVFIFFMWMMEYFDLFSKLSFTPNYSYKFVNCYKTLLMILKFFLL